MNFSKKKVVEMLKFTDLWALEKKGQLRQLFSLETLKFLSQTGFEPVTLRATVGSLIH